MNNFLSTEQLSVKERWQVFFFAVITLFILYISVGRLTEEFTHPQDLETWVDPLVPLSPIWLVIYIYMYFQTIAPFFVITTRRSFTRLLIGVAVLYTLALPIWIFFPVTRPGESVLVQDVWTHWLSIIYLVDPSTNCFPSMHVALSFYTAWYIVELDRLIGWVLFMGSFLIWYSTLALKQHWFVDGAVAILLVLAVEAILKRIIPWTEEEKKVQPRINHCYWFFGVIFGELLFIGYYFWKIEGL